MRKPSARRRWSSGFMPAFRCGFSLFARGRAGNQRPHPGRTGGVLDQVFTSKKGTAMKLASGRVTGKVIVVTAGYGDIGRATCRRLCEEGARVVMTGRKTPEEGSLIAKATQTGAGTIEYLRCDAGDRPSIDAMFARSVATSSADRRCHRQRGHGRERPIPGHPARPVAGAPRLEPHGQFPCGPGGGADHGDAGTDRKARLRARRPRQDPLQRLVGPGVALARGLLLRGRQGGAGAAGPRHGPGTGRPRHSRERDGAGHRHGRAVENLLRDRPEVRPPGDRRHPLARVRHSRAVRRRLPVPGQRRVGLHHGDLAVGRRRRQPAADGINAPATEPRPARSVDLPRWERVRRPSGLEEAGRTLACARPDFLADSLRSDTMAIAA